MAVSYERDKNGVDHVITVMVLDAEVGGKNADMQGILLNAHQQVVQQMTLEGRAAQAVSSVKSLAELDGKTLLPITDADTAAAISDAVVTMSKQKKP